MILFSKKVQTDSEAHPVSFIGYQFALEWLRSASEARTLLLCTPWDPTAHPDEFKKHRISPGRSQWPSGLGCGFAGACLLRLRVRIPPGAWMSVSCECCVLSVEKSLWRADHSSRGLLPIMVCDSVIKGSNNCYTYSEKVERGQGRERKILSDHKYQCATVKQSTDNPSNLMYNHLTIKLRNKKQ